MGIVEKFKNMVGAGQPKATIELDQQRISRGGTLSGRILISGGDHQITVHAADIAVGSDQKHPGNMPRSGGIQFKHLESVPCNAYVLRPSETIVVPFDVNIPFDLMTSGESLTHLLKVSINTAGTPVIVQTDFFVS